MNAFPSLDQVWSLVMRISSTDWPINHDLYGSLALPTIPAQHYAAKPYVIAAIFCNGSAKADTVRKQKQKRERLRNRSLAKSRIDPTINVRLPEAAPPGE
jgi:hypothetical protein